jgi:two-component system, chemotaxis family, CheB/CheR fusion protein
MNDKAEEEGTGEFEDLLDHIHRNHGFDFRGYKRSSLRRRVERRMQAVGIADFGAYLAVLEAEPREYPQLLDSILINVTSFFRDPPAWKALGEKVLPKLLGQTEADEPIRVWSAGCATGEEPYSLAMSLIELMGLDAFQRRVKVYATDLDEDALSFARNATYETERVSAVPDELRSKYFEVVNGRCIFRRDLRKSIIFGRHNLLLDAPISKIDLLTCRNLLIYLDVETQARVLPRLHYALNENGILFLGKAETQLAHSKLFEAVDLRCRIFRRRTNGGVRAFFGGMEWRGSTKQPPAPRILEGLLNACASPVIGVSTDGTLLYANAGAQRMFGIGPADFGEAFQDLQVSYRPVELRNRIDEAVQGRRPIRIEDMPYARSAAENHRLTIEVVPFFSDNGRHLGTAIVFCDDTRLYEAQQQLATVNNMLDTTVEELQSANEELETTNEEIQSTNEELETTNEELQSANEELETTNEELRSTNDELETANEELRLRSEQLDAYRVHTELVLGSIRTGIVVLDAQRQVTSWNRWNENMWGLRMEEAKGRVLFGLDIGVPIERLRPAVDAALSGQTPEPVRLDALDRRGRPITCEIMISPLSANGDVSGAVIAIDDITERPPRG